MSNRRRRYLRVRVKGETMAKMCAMLDTFSSLLRERDPELARRHPIYKTYDGLQTAPDDAMKEDQGSHAQKKKEARSVHRKGGSPAIGRSGGDFSPSLTAPHTRKHLSRVTPLDS